MTNHVDGRTIVITGAAGGFGRLVAQRLAALGGSVVAADVNDDGRANLADAITALTWLFLDGPEPASPFPDCGEDPEPDLSCETPPDC